jgi:hypothetical protein
MPNMALFQDSLVKEESERGSVLNKNQARGGALPWKVTLMEEVAPNTFR